MLKNLYCFSKHRYFRTVFQNVIKLFIVFQNNIYFQSFFKTLIAAYRFSKRQKLMKTYKKNFILKNRKLRQKSEKTYVLKNALNT